VLDRLQRSERGSSTSGKSASNPAAPNASFPARSWNAPIFHVKSYQDINFSVDTWRALWHLDLRQDQDPTRKALHAHSRRHQAPALRQGGIRSEIHGHPKFTATALGGAVMAEKALRSTGLRRRIAEHLPERRAGAEGQGAPAGYSTAQAVNALTASLLDAAYFERAVVDGLSAVSGCSIPARPFRPE
jgi:hypothetical protein